MDKNPWILRSCIYFWLSSNPWTTICNPLNPYGNRYYNRNIKSILSRPTIYNKSRTWQRRTQEIHHCHPRLYDGCTWYGCMNTTRTLYGMGTITPYHVRMIQCIAKHLRSSYRRSLARILCYQYNHQELGTIIKDRLDNLTPKWKE